MYISGEDINAMKPLLQEDLDTLSNWYNENCLTINTRKTKIMTFATPQMVNKNLYGSMAWSKVRNKVHPTTVMKLLWDFAYVPKA